MQVQPTRESPFILPRPNGMHNQTYAPSHRHTCTSFPGAVHVAPCPTYRRHSRNTCGLGAWHGRMDVSSCVLFCTIVGIVA